MDNQNACDYDHMTNEETRLLPIGGGGNIICCKRHYNKEIRARGEWAQEQKTQPVTIMLPAWESLTVYAERAQ
jgi:hypothetical protein